MRINNKPTEEGTVSESSDVEFRLLIEGIFLRYGYDFREYAASSLRRRVATLLTKFRLEDPLALLRLIIKDERFFREVLPHFTVGTSEMFRDPLFFKSLRENVVPTLRTYPSLNLWIAGSSTGEELYSLAILLKEEGLFDRSVIFATDINPNALKAAQEGIYSAEQMQINTKNYTEAGGTESLSAYYTSGYGYAKMDSELTTNVVFSEHNLVTDHVFTECHLVLCRNVLIYFNRGLQDRVLSLFRDSLRHGGFLGIGSKENLRFSVIAPDFDTIDDKWRIYRRNLSRGKNG